VKAFLTSHVKRIRTIKAVVGVVFGIMILTDVILVMLEQQKYPTFSWVVPDNRPGLIWLTFLFGGLVAKVFYNRKVQLKEKEVTGFLAFMSVASMLFVLGFSIESVGNFNQLIILLCGGIAAHRIWPQYVGRNE
jgi:hypothetical protein